MGQFRGELGDFVSIACFKAIIVGMENTFGKAAAETIVKAAGYTRGVKLVEDWRLDELQELDLLGLQQRIADALGKSGTRLFVLDKIERTDERVYRFFVYETIAAAGEPLGSSRQCVYTLGVLEGVLSKVTGSHYAGRQIASVLRGGNRDVFEYVPQAPKSPI